MPGIKEQFANTPKWVWLAGGGLFIGLIVLTKASGGSTTLPGLGQTGDLTDAVNALQDAINGNGGTKPSTGGGGGGGTGGTTGQTGSGQPTTGGQGVKGVPTSTGTAGGSGGTYPGSGTGPFVIPLLKPPPGGTSGGTWTHVAPTTTTVRSLPTISGTATKSGTTPVGVVSTGR